MNAMPTENEYRSLAQGLGNVAGELEDFDPDAMYLKTFPGRCWSIEGWVPDEPDAKAPAKPKDPFRTLFMLVTYIGDLMGQAQSLFPDPVAIEAFGVLASTEGTCHRATRSFLNCPPASRARVVRLIRDAVARARERCAPALEALSSRLWGQAQATWWAQQQKPLAAGEPPPRRPRDGDPLPPAAPPDGTVDGRQIWLGGRPRYLPEGLRNLLSYVLLNRGVSDDAVIRHCAFGGPSHLHSRLATLRKRVRVVLRDHPRRLHIRTKDRCLYCDWQ
jgi:hypothetical protein